MSQVDLVPRGIHTLIALDRTTLGGSQSPTGAVKMLAEVTEGTEGRSKVGGVGLPPLLSPYYLSHISFSNLSTFSPPTQPTRCNWRTMSRDPKRAKRELRDAEL